MSKDSIQLLSNYQYKKNFLPYINEHILLNESKIQIYRIEEFLKGILIPVLPYRTTFNFLLLITKGELVQNIYNEEYLVSKDEIINITQGNITVTSSISNDIEGYFIVYENDFLNDLVLRDNNLKFSMVNPHIILSPENSVWIQAAIELMHTEVANNSETKMTISTLIFESILIKIYHGKTITKDSANRPYHITHQFRELVQKHHLDHKNVLFYANMLHISENYLYKCVKESTGNSPKLWINEISILHSQILLQDRNRDIASIAFELKFESPSYFTRLFKKVVKMSPSEYRKLKFMS